MNKYRKIWDQIEDPQTRPVYARNIVEMDYENFETEVLAQNSGFANQLAESLYAGDIYILKRGFPKELMTDLLEKVYDIWSLTPSSFHKMLEGCPNYHRITDDEIAKKYAVESVRHSYYWFLWNEDPVGVTPDIIKRWRIFKFLGGYNLDEYEKNTPKDGIIDRFQIARYLPGIGRSATHSDPCENQKFFISVFMSTRGVDYKKGGFYVVGPGDQLIDIENHVEVGDIGIGFATVMHGVDRIDPDQKPDWTTKDGRWWLGLYSNSSDYVANRVTAKSAKITLSPS